MTDSFDAFYHNIYKDRWSQLKEALIQTGRAVARMNFFSDGRPPSDKVIDPDFRCYALEAGQEPQADANGLLGFYRMDYASLFPVKALGVGIGQRVLDLCASPGGKGLVMIERLFESGEIVLNEVSKTCKARLVRVLKAYLPQEIFKKVRVTGHDGSRWCLNEKNAYDRILVDAPCSGEAHLLHDPNEMRTWKPSRTKGLAKRQYALLASAMQVVKAGGRVVYSTCSISPSENDGVVARLFKKRPEGLCLIKDKWPMGEPTEFGWQILPDKTGWGPIYFVVLQKG